MAGPHSGWPYPTGDPLPTQDEIDERAVKALLKVARGKSKAAVARELGISRPTLYRALESISLHLLPARDLGFAIQHSRIEWAVELLVKRVLNADGVSAETFIRALAELRQMSIAQRVLIEAMTGGVPTSESDDPEVTEWVAAEHEESEDELRKVRNGDGHSD